MPNFGFAAGTDIGDAVGMIFEGPVSWGKPAIAKTLKLPKAET